jgi:hypothetical protein
LGIARGRGISRRGVSCDESVVYCIARRRHWNRNTFHLFSHSPVICPLLLLSCKNHESCLRGYQAPSSVIPVTHVFASSLPNWLVSTVHDPQTSQPSPFQRLPPLCNSASIALLFLEHPFPCPVPPRCYSLSNFQCHDRPPSPLLASNAISPTLEIVHAMTSQTPIVKRV